MERCKVEFKAFKIGEWYTKTETDNSEEDLCLKDSM